MAASFSDAAISIAWILSPAGPVSRMHLVHASFRENVNQVVHSMPEYEF